MISFIVINLKLSIFSFKINFNILESFFLQNLINSILKMSHFLYYI